MNTKKLYSGLIAILMIASAAVAFKAPVKEVRAVQWFQYNGGGITNPANYSELPGIPSCNSGSKLCAIEAEEDGMTGRPTQDGVDHPDDTRLKP